VLDGDPGRPSRWALAHISSSRFICGPQKFHFQTFWGSMTLLRGSGPTRGNLSVIPTLREEIVSADHLSLVNGYSYSETCKFRLVFHRQG